MTKKFLSVLLLITITFSSTDNAKCFSASSEISYDNCTRVFENYKVCEAQLNKTNAENASIRMTNYILGGMTVLFLGIILGKPIWQCLNLAAWELNTWENRLFKDVRLENNLNTMRYNIDFLNKRVNGLAKKIGFSEIHYNDIEVQTE